MDYQSKDLEAYNQWKQTGSKEHMSALLGSLSPVIFKEVSRQQGTLPKAALEAEAKKWAVKAIQTYDPSKNTSLATHVTGYLRKIRRMNYQYQNAARLPENLQINYTPYMTAKAKLEDMLNREPTEEEIAKELGWSKKQVARLGSSLYQDLSESGSANPSEVSRYNNMGVVMKHIRENLTPEEEFILDNPNMSMKDMCAHLNVNQARYSYLKKKLVDKVLKLKQEAEGVLT